MKHLTAFVEVSLFYIIYFVINARFFPDMPGFFQINPHPYWLGILLFSFRYGVVASFLAGVASSILYFYYATQFFEPYQLADGEHLVPISLFLFGSLLIGLSASRLQRKNSFLNENLGKLESTLEQIKEENGILSEINQNLEKKMVSKMATLITLYEGARKLDTSNPEELYQAAVSFISKTLGAGSVGLYFNSNGEGWVCKALEGSESLRLPSSFGIKLMELASSSQKIVTIKDLNPSFQKESFDLLMAGPLKAGVSKNIQMVIGVSSIPLMEFNSATINLFSFLIDWISRAMLRIEYIISLDENEIIDPVLQVYSSKYFRSRFSQEFMRSKTYYLPLTIGSLHVDYPADVLPRIADQVTLSICQLLKKSLRTMDIVAKRADSPHTFYFLMITASLTSSQELVADFIQKLKALGLDSRIKVSLGLASYNPTMAHEREMFDEVMNKMEAIALK